MKVSFRKAGILAVAIITMALIFGFEPISISIAQADTNTISGKIIKIDWGSFWSAPGRRKAVLHVKTAKGNVYQIHTGIKTSYNPHKTPEVGDRISCEVIKDGGIWSAYTVNYK